MDQQKAVLEAIADDEAKPKSGHLASLKKQWATSIPKREAQAIVWTQLSTAKTQNGPLPDPIPLIVGTVDTPHYRMRYQESLRHIEKWIAEQQACTCALHKKDGSCCSSIVEPEPCYLLNMEEHPSLGVKKIVFEGWRQKLLPRLRHEFIASKSTTIDFVLVAEDDIRIPDHISPCHLVQLCRDAFASHPHLDLLSLGHSWKALQKQTKIRPQDVENRNLLRYLQSAKGAGVHGATLFAIQCPRGIERLHEALEQAAQEKKQTHLDQFLFFSTLHTLNIALLDPPVVGWAEVEVTLTKSSSGHRRRGGGRLGFLPGKETEQDEDDDDVTWIQRQVVPVPEGREQAHG